MGHFILTVNKDTEEVNASLEMTPVDFIESLAEVMVADETIRALILATVEVYNIETSEDKT